MNRTASTRLHLGFVLTGVVTTLLGPMLPWLMGRWSLTDAQAGYLFTAQFLGSMSGVALSGYAVRRLGFRSALVFGYAVLALGTALLTVTEWPSALGPVFTWGIGLGVTIPATNLCVSDANPQRRAAALNLLNLAWGIGAVLCPAVVATLQERKFIGYFFPALAVALIFVTTSVALTRALSSTDGRANPRSPAETPAPERTPKVLAVVALAMLFYFYVGTESSLSGWIAAYASRINADSHSAWLLAPSFFWAALLFGRAISPLALRHCADIKVAEIGLTLAAAGTTTLIAATNIPAVLIAVSLSGIGLASVYPITIALMSHWFGQSVSRVAPFMFALASLGGATLPWTVGRLSTHLGSLRSGLLIPLLTNLLMLSLYVFASRKRFIRTPEDGPHSEAIHA